MATEPVILFAHGAGAGPDSEFMCAISDQLSGMNMKVHRFEFPYWSKIRESGKKRPPDRQPLLQQTMIEEAQRLGDQPLWLMGKSMGARVAFQCADILNAKGAIALGFPFHPASKPDQNRTPELTNNRPRNLVIQGTRDPLGKSDWVSKQALPENVMIQWLEQGDHDLIPTRATGVSKQQSWSQVAQLIAKFIKEHV